MRKQKKSENSKLTAVAGKLARRSAFSLAMFTIVLGTGAPAMATVSFTMTCDTVTSFDIGNDDHDDDWFHGGFNEEDMKFSPHNGSNSVEFPFITGNWRQPHDNKHENGSWSWNGSQFGWTFWHKDSGKDDDHIEIGEHEYHHFGEGHCGDKDPSPPAAVPVPATLPLLLSGLAGMLGLQRSRKKMD